MPFALNFPKSNFIHVCFPSVLVSFARSLSVCILYIIFLRNLYIFIVFTNLHVFNKVYSFIFSANVSVDESPIEEEFSGPTAAELRLPKNILPIWFVFSKENLCLLGVAFFHVN